MIKGVTYTDLGPFFYIIQNLQASPIPQTSFLIGTFFDPSPVAVVGFWLFLVLKGQIRHWFSTSLSLLSVGF